MNKVEKIWKLVERLMARNGMVPDQFSETDALSWLGDLKLHDAEKVTTEIEARMNEYRAQTSKYPLFKRIFPKRDSAPNCLTARIIQSVQRNSEFARVKGAEEEKGCAVKGWKPEWGLIDPIELQLLPLSREERARVDPEYWMYWTDTREQFIRKRLAELTR